MNRYQEELLKLAHDNYNKSGSSYAEYQTGNSDEWFYYSNAAEELEEQGIIKNLASHNLRISYELTPQGIAIFRQRYKGTRWSL